MTASNIPFVVFNGGEIGPENLSRVDHEKYPNTAETMENWLPAVQGEMSFRGGLAFEEEVADSDELTVVTSFRFSATQFYDVALSDYELRIRQDGSTIVREAVTCTIADGDFASLSGWTDISTGGGAAAISSGRLKLTSDGASIAGVRQLVTTSSANSLHAVDIVVTRGPVLLKIGSTSGGIEYLAETTLRTGVHSLSFTPTGSFYVEITSTAKVERYVDSIEIASAGDLVLATPWPEAQLRYLQTTQSGDVLFIANATAIPKRLERRSVTSWSLVDIAMDDGPFETINTDESLTLTPSVIAGNGTLTASRALFQSTHVGSIWKITHSGQLRERTINGAGQFSDTIRVVGVSASRAFTWTIAGSFTATVTLQRSIGNTSAWADVDTKTAAGGPHSVTDSLDNQIVYYRVGVKTGDYTSGTITVTLDYPGGTTDGICRITGYTSATALDMEVVSPFGDTSESFEWAEGAWSDYRGWPEAVCQFDGRTYWGFGDRFRGSVSDGLESFLEGDEAADSFGRSVATGDVNPIRWFLPLQRLIMGTDGAEPSARSSSFDSPLSATDLTLRDASTLGVARVQPVRIDSQGIYVDGTTYQVRRMVYSVESNDYVSRPASEWHKYIGKPGIVQMAVQRFPDTRVYMIRSDGQCIVLLYDPDEQVKGWSRLVTDGEFESVVVHRGIGEDTVRFVVKRTIGGQTKRYWEKLSSIDITASTESRFADSHVYYSGAATTTITGLDHLEGEDVVVWAGGAYHAARTVASGQITLSRSVTTACVGLTYTGTYKSSRLAYAARKGTALAQIKRPASVSIQFRNSILGGLEYGQGLTTMDRVPDRLTASATYDTAPPLVTYETPQKPVPGGLNQDPRLYIRAQAPYGPVTVQHLVVGLSINEK